MAFYLQINVLHMIIANVIWPFQRFGLAGCLVAFVYWPIAIPFTCVVIAIYYLPAVYLTVRMLFYSKRSFLRYATQRIRISLISWMPQYAYYVFYFSRSLLIKRWKINKNFDNIAKVFRIKYYLKQKFRINTVIRLHCELLIFSEPH